MNDNRTERKEMEIDIQRLISAVWKKAWLIMLIAVLCAILTFVGTRYLITPMYQSSAMFYVNNSSLSVGDATFSIDSGDISAAKSLVDSYIVILRTRESLNDVIDYAGVDRTFTELKGMISAASVNSTEIFEVVVTSPDPQEAQRIADAIAYILPKRISSIIEGTSAKVVDAAVVAVKPSSPSYSLNTFVGFVVGFALSVLAILLREFFDISIRSEEDITMCGNAPVLAAVPDMSVASKGGYYRSYNTGEKKKSGLGKKQISLIGGDINFAATEAYKLLRTKLQFSFTDDKASRVIGVSSALAGEGKSLSAINLAYSLSQLDKRVLLIDCDMRKPSISTKLPIMKTPGLSNYLSGQTAMEVLFQRCGITYDEEAFAVISAGRNPPNPVELLSSSKMAKMLNRLRESFDYIILDLPPVGEVSDALAVAKETDGILLVVRQNYGNRKAYMEAIRQFAFVGAKILGVVYNCTTDNAESYGKKYYSKYNPAKSNSAVTGGKYASSAMPKTATSKNQAETEK